MKEGEPKMEDSGLVDFGRYSELNNCRHLGRNEIVVTEAGSNFYFSQDRAGIPILRRSEHFGTRRQRRASSEVRRKARLAFDTISASYRPPSPEPPKKSGPPQEQLDLHF